MRPQIVLLLALVLTLSFVPLYFAVSTYTRTAQSVMQRQQALELTQALQTAFQTQEPTEVRLRQLLSGRVQALKYASSSRTAFVASAGLPSDWTPPAGPLDETPSLHSTPLGVWVGVRPRDGSELWVFVTPPPTLLQRLDQLLLSYMAIAALVLLAALYFIVTYRMIRPLEELSHAARRVTETDRPLTLPLARSREFHELNASLTAMTNRLQLEEDALRAKIGEVEKRTTELRAAQAQVVRSERLASVGQLAAGVAHEIGNPIAALLGLQDLILQGGLSPEEEREFVRRMRKETERIHRIVRDLLQFARSKPSAADGGLPHASLTQALEETASLLAPQPAFREIRVHRRLDDALPDVGAPHEALVQILLNLLLNAAGACGQRGNIIVRARLWRPPPSLTENPEALHADSTPALPRYVELSVEDDGPGVPPRLRETLFEPFVTGKDVGQGTGLGLSVCRNLVEQVADATGAVHTTIELDQTFTSGARFVVRLPTSSHTT